jgi:Tropinone reductase 1
MWNLKDKKVFVTGGTKGIGKATVLAMLELGAEVLFSGRNGEEVSRLQDELQSRQFHAHGIQGDISDENSQREIVNWIKDNWGKLDVLVNNAGINIRRASVDFTQEEYHKIINIDMLAPFEIARQLLPLLAAGNNAAIVNVASVAGTLDVRTGAPYGMAKAGLIQQTRILAAEWATHGIRVNAVSPWFTETPLTEGLLSDADKVKNIIQRTPLKRVARAEEMANVIAFLAMEQSSYINGQNIVVDGGMSVTAL